MRAMELQRVRLGVKLDNPQPIGPPRYGRRCLKLDPHLAKHAHRAVAQRLEQPAGGNVGLHDGVVDPSYAAAGCILLKPGRDQPPDPSPERVRVDIPLGAPQLAFRAQLTVADDPLAVTHDTRALREIEV